MSTLCSSTMKASLEVAVAVVLLALGSAEHRQEAPSTRGVPAPLPQWGYVGRRSSTSCPQPICPDPVCPQPVCPPPAPAPPAPPCPKPVCPVPECPQLVCPKPVCPRPSCPSPPAPLAQTCPARGATCAGCLWKVLTTYDHFHGFGFYKIHQTKKNWHQAKALCAEDGGHLGVINSEDEAEIFKLLYQRNKELREIFIGIHNLDDLQWKTVTGEPLSETGYIKWRPSEPTGGDEHCGTMDRSGLFNDIYCDWRFGFICEVHEKNAFGCK